MTLDPPPNLSQNAAPDYHLGMAYALLTAALLALQEPFSALAARKLSAVDFLAFTQVSLLLSIPLLLARPRGRQDFVTILTTRAYWPKLLVLLGVGGAGLALYDVALSSAHPIITAAVLNLSPFWAALVARVVSGRSTPRPRAVFVGCFLAAFAGAMIVAFSQIEADPSALKRDLLYSLMHSRWALALPMPVFFALSGTLVYEWFRDFDEGAAISANFLVSAAVLIPLALLVAHGKASSLTVDDAPAIFLLLIGTLTSSAAGRLFYQAALTATRNDNGFVTMFFLAIPGISAAVSWALSGWVTALRVNASATFFEGLLLVMAPLAVFSIVTARRQSGAAKTSYHVPRKLDAGF